MKIALLTPFYPYRGGIAQFSGRFYQEIADNADVKVFSFSRLYPDFLFPGKTQYVEEEDKILEYPSERILDSINPFSYQKTVNEINRFAPDVLIMAYWMSFFAPAYGHIAHRLKKKTKVIALVHNAIPHEPNFFDRPLTKLFFKQVDTFVALSENVKDDILSLLPDADADKIIVTPHPLYDHYAPKIDRRDALARLSLSPDKKTILFFGLIRDYKGLDLLIEAMGKADDSVQLVIAGECYGSFDKYANQIKASPARDRIKIMARYIAESEVPILFSAADLLALPYKSATQSGVIPLAYHYEVPIVATDVGGLKDSIRIPQTGLIATADPDSIAHSIIEFFASDKQFFIDNIRREKQHLSWDKFAELFRPVKLPVSSRETPSFIP